jgi:hypothetical protein
MQEPDYCAPIHSFKSEERVASVFKVGETSASGEAAFSPETLVNIY